MGSNPSHFQGPEHPVEQVSWDKVQEFIRSLNTHEGRALYRLPTEAEWEYAARGGSTTAYSFGDQAGPLGEYAWYAANAKEQPQPVGRKKPNKFGLHDMHGNVAEWCLDQYDAAAYKKFASTPAVRPVIVPGPARFPHVARGGSWQDPPARLRSAARRGSEESWSKKDPQSPRSIWWHTEGTFIGFRVVRALEEQPELVNVRSKMTRNSPDR